METSRLTDEQSELFMRNKKVVLELFPNHSCDAISSPLSEKYVPVVGINSIGY